MYAKFHVINLAAERTYNDLDVSLKKANGHRNDWFEGVQRCHLDETIFIIMERIVRAEVHRLVVADENEKVIGIISLSDILLYLVLRPSGEGIGGSEQSLRATDPAVKGKSTNDEDEAENRSPSGSGNPSIIEDIEEEAEAHKDEAKKDDESDKSSHSTSSTENLKGNLNGDNEDADDNEKVDSERVKDWAVANNNNPNSDDEKSINSNGDKNLDVETVDGSKEKTQLIEDCLVKKRISPTVMLSQWPKILTCMIQML